MAQGNTKRRVLSPDVDGLELLLGRRAPPTGESRAPAPRPSDDELIGYIKRSLAGEPFPVSAPRLRTASEEAIPLALRIREILRSEQANDSIAASAENRGPAELPPVPMPSVAVAPPMPVPEAARPAPARHPEPRVALSALDVDLPTFDLAPSPRRPALGWGAVAFVLLITVGGACVPGVFAPTPRYDAEARLQLLGTARTTPGFMEATSLRLVSPRLLSQVVTRLKLDHDAEFSGGKATSYSVVMDLLTDSGAAADSFSRAQAALLRAVTVAPDRQAGALGVVVQSHDPKKSARIANFLADVAVRDAASKPFAGALSETDVAVETNRKRYDDANSALAAFKTAAGEDKIAAATDLMERRDALEKQVSTANSAVQAASIRLSAAKAVKMADVLDGSISPDLGSPAPLEDLRNRYAAARSSFAQLSTQLGPRHPRLLAVQSTIDTLGGAILAEIQKMVAASDADVRTTSNQLKQMKERLAQLDQQPVEVDLAAFGKLQDDAEAARQAYENSMTAAQDAQPAAGPVEVPLALATPATPPTEPVDDNLIGRSLIGALCGLGLAIAMVGCRWLLRRAPRDETHHEALDFTAVDLLASVPDLRELSQPAIERQQQRFDASAPVANDRPAASAAPAADKSDPALAALIGDVASLRAKVASYVMERQASR